MAAERLIAENSDRRCRRTPVSFAFVIATALLAAGVAAQSQSTQAPAQTSSAQQPSDQRPTFRTGADVVRIDVTAFDRKGMPVTTLTADDFEVFEDDMPQAIQSFKFISVTGQPESGDDTSLPIRSPEHAAAEARRDDVRVFLIFWDEYHIGRFQSALMAKEYLTRFVLEDFGPTDLVAFMDPLTTLDSIRFTRDRRELAEIVRNLRGRQGEYFPPRSVVEEAHLQQMRDIERLRSEVTISALKAAAVHLGALRQGRKSIILLSEGMRGLPPQDEQPLLLDLTRAANDGNTAFYAINPRGLTTMRWSPFDTLKALATNTGGDFSTTNEFTRALKRVVSQSSASYLMGYAPAQPRVDGKFHKIKVRVKRPGIEVRARAGYWAPSVADMERAEKLAAASPRTEIQSALAQLTPSAARRSIDLWVGTGLATSGRPQISVAWAPRPQSTGQSGSVASTVTITATGERGGVFSGDVGSEGTHFEAPAGEVQLTATSRDTAGEIVDRDMRTIVVPDPAKLPLWISSPTIVSATGPVEWRNAINDSSPIAASRDFTTNQRLLIRFAVNGRNAERAALSARLMNRQGVSTTTLKVSPSRHGGYEIDLPLASIVRGEFLIAIEAADAEARAEAFVPLRIVR